MTMKIIIILVILLIDPVLSIFAFGANNCPCPPPPCPNLSQSTPPCPVICIPPPPPSICSSAAIQSPPPSASVLNNYPFVPQVQQHQPEEIIVEEHSFEYADEADEVLGNSNGAIVPVSSYGAIQPGNSNRAIAPDNRNGAIKPDKVNGANPVRQQPIQQYDSRLGYFVRKVGEQNFGVQADGSNAPLVFVNSEYPASLVIPEQGKPFQLPDIHQSSSSLLTPGQFQTAGGNSAPSTLIAAPQPFVQLPPQTSQPLSGSSLPSANIVPQSPTVNSGNLPQGSASTGVLPPSPPPPSSPISITIEKSHRRSKSKSSKSKSKSSKSKSKSSKSKNSSSSSSSSSSSHSHESILHPRHFQLIAPAPSVQTAQSNPIFAPPIYLPPKFAAAGSFPFNEQSQYAAGPEPILQPSYYAAAPEPILQTSYIQQSPPQPDVQPILVIQPRPRVIKPPPKKKPKTHQITSASQSTLDWPITSSESPAPSDNVDFIVIPQLHQEQQPIVPSNSYQSSQYVSNNQPSQYVSNNQPSQYVSNTDYQLPPNIPFADAPAPAPAPAPPPSQTIAQVRPRQTQIVVRDRRQVAKVAIVNEQDTTGSNDGAVTDRCNSEQLRSLIIDNIENGSTEISKQRIKWIAEQRLHTIIDVICSTTQFSFVTNSARYCTAQSETITCFAYEPAVHRN